jgi:hypothetical protein
MPAREQSPGTGDPIVEIRKSIGAASLGRGSGIVYSFIGMVASFLADLILDWWYQRSPED